MEIIIRIEKFLGKIKLNYSNIHIIIREIVNLFYATFKFQHLLLKLIRNLVKRLSTGKFGNAQNFSIMRILEFIT